MVQRGSQAPTVLLVDDDADVRLLWRMVFALHGGFGVISEAADGGEALEMLEAEFFDVVVTDFSMPGVSGLEVVDATLAGWPSTVVVMVSATADVGHEALRRGASAFFDKWESTTDRLPRFLTAVLAEYTKPSVWISPELVSVTDEEWPGARDPVRGVASVIAAVKT